MVFIFIFFGLNCSLFPVESWLILYSFTRGLLFSSPGLLLSFLVNYIILWNLKIRVSLQNLFSFCIVLPSNKNCICFVLKSLPINFVIIENSLSSIRVVTAIQWFNWLKLLNHENILQCFCWVIAKLIIRSLKVPNWKYWLQLLLKLCLCPKYVNI